MRFTGIPFDAIDRFWPIISPVLAPAIERSRGDHTVESVHTALVNQDMQLFAYMAGDLSACNMAVVTQIKKYDTGRLWCEIVFCAGSGREDWLHYIAHIETWAQQMGCDGMRVIGRKGWARLLPGYEEVAVLLRKDFTNA